MNANFYDLPDAERFSIYAEIDALECKTTGYGEHGMLQVAVARGKLGALLQAMQNHGMVDVSLVNFPLGSDQPPEILRHGANWLYADFALQEH